jgi:hypothetical protein
LEGVDYVKNTLIVDSDDLEFLYIKILNYPKSEIAFLDNIKYKDPNNF